MKFSEIAYKRPDIEQLKKDFSKLLQQFEEANTLKEQKVVLQEIYRLRKNFSTMSNIASIRHTIDTTDTQYEEERNFYDENSPEYSKLINDFYQKLVNSRFRKEMELEVGHQLFSLADMALKSFSPEVVEEMKQENRLRSKYTKLLASAKIVFEGEEYNLSGLTPFEMSPDRSLRKRASEAKYAFLADNEPELDDIYDQLVKLRHAMATKLGFKNYVELAYAKLARSEYDSSDVAVFREEVRKHIVPLATKLRERQKERLELGQLFYYDENLNFKGGNAQPKGNPDWIVKNGQKMYEELSAETNEFFHFMIDNELMDLVNKKGKAPGGYCTFIPNYGAPFIFSNFNGTAHDIDVLTHEAGHAFQVYQSRHQEIMEYNWPTYEACEIHSMSMEFFTWPWMDLFFKDDTNKYKFGHLSGSLLFIPYGVTVDEFQHFVYENPEATPEERKKQWRRIEQKYLPHRNYDGNDYLENGGFWHKQSHIFQNPFYYIDYTLAQVCAFQFWSRMNNDRPAAWNDYVKLCRAGGSKPFLELVAFAGLKNPFETGNMQAVVKEIDAWLEKTDDKSFD